MSTGSEHRKSLPPPTEVLEEAFRCRHRLGHVAWLRCAHELCRETSKIFVHYIDDCAKLPRRRRRACVDCQRFCGALFEHARLCRMVICHVFKCGEAKKAIRRGAWKVDVSVIAESLPSLAAVAAMKGSNALCTWPPSKLQDHSMSSEGESVEYGGCGGGVVELLEDEEEKDEGSGFVDYVVLSNLNSVYLTPRGEENLYLPDDDFTNTGVRLGHGAFSEVTLAIDKDKATLIALKKLFSPDSLNQVELDVLREAQHPNVMRLYGATQYDNKVYMFQEYAMSGDLSQLVTAQGPIPENVALHLFKQVLQGLNYIHTICNVIHRDIKPDNVLVFDEAYHVKIADFGLAIRLEDVDLDVERSYPPGTENYMPPEAARGERYFANRDCWSAACVLLMLITGRMPYYEQRHLGTLLFVVGNRPNGPDLPAGCSERIRSLFGSVFSEATRRPSADELLKHGAFLNASPAWNDEQDRMIIDPDCYDGLVREPPTDEFSLPYPDVSLASTPVNHSLFPIREVPSSLSSSSMTSATPKQAAETREDYLKNSPLSPPQHQNSSDELRSQFVAKEQATHTAGSSVQSSAFKSAGGLSMSMEECKEIQQYSRQLVLKNGERTTTRPRTNSSTRHRHTSSHEMPSSGKHYTRSRSRARPNSRGVDDKSGVALMHQQSADVSQEFVSAPRTSVTRTGTDGSESFATATDGGSSVVEGYLKFSVSSKLHDMELGMSKKGRVIATSTEPTETATSAEEEVVEEKVEKTGTNSGTTSSRVGRATRAPLPMSSHHQDAYSGTFQLRLLSEDKTQVLKLRYPETTVGSLAEDKDVQAQIREKLPDLTTFTFLCLLNESEDEPVPLDASQKIVGGATICLVVVGATTRNTWFIDDTGHLSYIAVSPMQQTI
ncbi:uncharacterized protein [Oscarella lobularis]|uniref:uncharacterized protein isoform X2 n=1 Tax=Oscarella lobularis TaxID=121494 RepID=UPI0033143ADF